MKRFVLGWIILTQFACGEDRRWMRYPSIRPDGQQIAFCYRGDVFLVDTQGGTATAVTQHPAYEKEPCWSPDGKQLVYASERYGNFDLFRQSLESGEVQRLTFHSAHDTPGDFSPDGKWCYFSSSRLDDPLASGFPSRVLPELYRVSLESGKVEQVLSTPAERVCIATDGTSLLYQDRKGYENVWRKHHTSSVARDIWRYDFASGKHRQLTTFKGEDRQPLWDEDGQVVFLSERTGTFNVWRFQPGASKITEQLTFFEKHPVRFLSRADDGTLCFGWHGELYTLKPGGKPVQVKVQLLSADGISARSVRSINGNIQEIALAPSGKELAFTAGGDVFVTSVEHKATRQVTATPERERSVSFHPDGRELLYASERDRSWNLYRSRITRDEEKQFYLATLLDEEVVLKTEAETFQPSYRPDGQAIAFLEERTRLRVLDVKSGEVRSLTDGSQYYSYKDGDLHYAWSPDGRWLVMDLYGYQRWIDEVGIVPADGSRAVTNLTHSGYYDSKPKWMSTGDGILWFSNRHGERAHGSWGGEQDVYGLFLTRAAYDRYRLSPEEFALLQETEAKRKKREKRKKEEAEEEDKDGEPDLKLPEAVAFDFRDLDERRVRLTLHSSEIEDAVLSPDGALLYTLSQFEKGHDLWKYDLYKREAKLLCKFDGEGEQMLMDREGKTLFVLSEGKVFQVDTEKGEKKKIEFEAEQLHDPYAERRYQFEHVWRQVLKKFYVKDLHGVDWNFYKAAYAPFLPHINNPYDFAEMLSEMLGELNASHTGSGYRPKRPEGDQTASLGLYYDFAHPGPGLRVKALLPRGPALKAEAHIVPGVIIEAIDGEVVAAGMNPWPLFNRKAGKRMHLALHNPADGKRWEVVLRPIPPGEESQLAYRRWVRSRRDETARLSKGRVGYVHVRSMSDSSYRAAFDEIFGRNSDKEALVVDTRFNGGGWLHDDLAVLLSGKPYVTFSPRGQENLGGEPMFRWDRPSAVLIGESNYSDAHMFPYAYKALGIGPLVGMPVPGTATAVWWERLSGGALYFGIPQVGVKTLDGTFLENNQLEPDVQVANNPESVAVGKDLQLEKAVELLLEKLD